MRLTILAVLLAASFCASATNPPNECGNHGKNCQPSGGSNEANSNANASGGNGYGGSGGDSSSIGVGLGVGVGTGGSATGGAGGSGGLGVGHGGDGGNAALIGSGNSSAHGGDAKAYGGSSDQGQLQGQQQGQSSKNTNVSGSKSFAQMASENTNRVNASSANDNRSSASGNQTAVTNNIGGDSTLVERNAPPVFLGNITATMSCAGGFNAGASDRNGSGAFGFSWISSDCRSVVIGREFVGIGMPDVACRVWKTTKGYKRAVKADPSLADVDCSVKPAPATAPVLAPELAPRIPRG